MRDVIYFMNLIDEIRDFGINLPGVPTPTTLNKNSQTTDLVKNQYIDKLRDKITNMEARANETPDIYTRIKQERNSLEKKVTELTAELTELKRTLVRFSLKNGKLDDSLKKVKEEKAGLLDEVERLKKQLSQLQLHDKEDAAEVMMQLQSSASEESSFLDGSKGSKVTDNP